MHNDDRLTQAEAEYILHLIEADRDGQPQHQQVVKIGNPLHIKLTRLLEAAKVESEKAYLGGNMERKRDRRAWKAPKLKLNGEPVREMPAGVKA